MKKMGLLIALFLTSLKAWADEYKIFIDAGSTGSRLHVFEIKTAGQQAPEIKDIFSESTKPGLSSFEKNPQDAGKSLAKITDDALRFLNTKQVDPKNVELQVLATAGMRLLPESSQKSIYFEVHQFLKHNFPFSVTHVETITGKTEGLYGWLDINYLTHHFQDHTPTVGTIDMGGASTQIAFETQDQSKPDDIVTLALNGQTYRVFSKSFLGLGLDQAREKMNIDANHDSCYPTHYQGTGRYDFARCAAAYENVIAQQHVVEAVVPHANQSFVGFSGLFYTYNFLGIDKNPDRAVVENQVNKICMQSWEQLKETYPTVDEKYLSVYCANGAYLDDLLYKTYQLHDHQLEVSGKINDRDIDWTLGAVLASYVVSGDGLDQSGASVHQ